MKEQMQTSKPKIVSLKILPSDTETPIYYETGIFSKELEIKYRERFKTLKKTNSVVNTCQYDDDVWLIYNDINTNSINLHLSKSRYKTHGELYTGISYDTITAALHCYACIWIGSVIAKTIAIKINFIKTVLENIGEEQLKDHESFKTDIEIFLRFAGVQSSVVDNILLHIYSADIIQDQNKARRLQPLINYLVLDSELEYMYEDLQSGIDEKILSRYFPVYVWGRLTSILPLRATETTILPYDCITREDNKVFLTVYRSQLKKKTKSVEYTVPRDYKRFTYEVPDTQLIHTIEYFRDSLLPHDRKYLFPPVESMPDSVMFRREHLNMLIHEFQETYIFHSHKYDFAKEMTGIDKFSFVNAGDMRHIALSNLLFNDTSLEVCRQLADHENIDVSYGYATNIAETIMHSSILHVQKQINDGLLQTKKKQVATSNKSSVCLSQSRAENPDSIEDCEKYGHLSDCFGCPLFLPSPEDMERHNRKMTDKLLHSAEALQSLLIKGASLHGKGDEVQQAFLKARTDAAKLRTVTDIKYNNSALGWLNSNNPVLIDR